MVNKGAFLSDAAENIPYVERTLGLNLSLFSNAVPQIRLVNSLLCEGIQDQQPLEKFTRYLNQHPLPSKQWAPLHISLFYQAITTFSYVLTVLGDRTEMAHSVEARLPFLDNNVVNFICRVDPKYKFHRGLDKFVLRESCKKYVTKTHFENKKHPYLAPPASKTSAFNQMMHDEFSSSRFINKNLFDHQKILNLLAKVEKAEQADPFNDKILFFILSLAVLDRIFDFK